MGYNKPNTVQYFFGCANTNYAANTIYYLASTSTATTADAYRILRALTGGFIRSIDLSSQCAANPTTEDIVVSIRVNSTDYPVGTFNYSGASTVLRVYNHALNVPVNEGDTLQVKMSLAAVFVTPPQSVSFYGHALMEI